MIVIELRTNPVNLGLPTVFCEPKLVVNILTIKNIQNFK